MSYRVMESIKTLLMVTAGLSLLLSLAVGGYYFKRYINWNMGYEDEVIRTIRSEVKQECLKYGK